ncbi:lycopene beta-cyclase CrtY [Rosenbergiella australiborealis]|uniref:Lycopene beta-cyclase CrtY n=1 Tax=Rosenbergiella australiborealis TaxID=1544696 RepID=A0ABS5T483_9GAMM|nr:lycopene beta-cyclase CrtY [Rosenbergiella australiborealis]MBT0727163.1 lycopene beta-cyclase CrtY [Rosenbergiella australiborealis]
MAEYDLILVGAGLANALIALRLKQKQPQLRLLIIEGSEQVLGNHTWSFHGSDLTSEQREWVLPWVDYCWPGYDVRFPELKRHLVGEYFSITSEQLAKQLTTQFAGQILTGCRVKHLSANQVKLDDGRLLYAQAVIDGRGFSHSPSMAIGIQAFVGQVWQLAKPHGLRQPILMDATVDQQQGYRFVYTLPLSATQLLIEDTHYIDQAQLDVEQGRRNIRDYAAGQGWELAQQLREEQGHLPITLAGKFSRFSSEHPHPCSGLRAGLYHATTGYSLPHAVALADQIAELSCIASPCLQAITDQFARQSWVKQRFFRMLNRMLFLAGPPTARRGVMQRFYRLNEALIARFYAGQLTFWDKLRIVSGKPPVPIIAALRAIMKPLIK